VRALSKKSSWRKREEEKKWRQSNDQNQEEEEVAIGERPAEGRQFVKINQQTFFGFQSFLFEKLRFVVVVLQLIVRCYQLVDDRNRKGLP
jgi:hypothetical protein